MNDLGDLIILAPLGKTKCFIHCKIGDAAKEEEPGVYDVQGGVTRLYVQGGVTRKVTGIFEDVTNVEVSMFLSPLTCKGKDGLFPSELKFQTQIDQIQGDVLKRIRNVENDVEIVESRLGNVENGIENVEDDLENLENEVRKILDV